MYNTYEEWRAKLAEQGITNISDEEIIELDDMIQESHNDYE